ncbi:hypothetical protein [Litoreibacter halocynthiae]|uniref:hypothetical protein n=1 Tax=Litoreibacter halocynthiae TaxID=1242689 RepID=UPI0024932908|nr:hypothetical protein [Litoreibacter halocynthiae]
MLEPAEGVTFRQTSDTYELVFEDGVVLSAPKDGLKTVTPKKSRPQDKIYAAASFRRSGERWRWFYLWTDGTVTEEGCLTCECGLPLTRATLSKDGYREEAKKLTAGARQGRYQLMKAFYLPVRDEHVEATLDELMAQFPSDKFLGNDFVCHTFECQTCKAMVEIGADTYRGPAFVERTTDEDARLQSREELDRLAAQKIEQKFYEPGGYN